MIALASVRTPQTPFLPGTSLLQADKTLRSNFSSFIPTSQRSTKTLKCRRSLKIQASGDGRGSGSTSIFVGGFVLGGLVVGSLGCIYAPQISKALAGADRKELMRKLPKFIYDEEKALERARKRIADEIAQINSALDDISAQIHVDDEANGNGTAVETDELEAHNG